MPLDEAAGTVGKLSRAGWRLTGFFRHLSPRSLRFIDEHVPGISVPPEMIES